VTSVGSPTRPKGTDMTHPYTNLTDDALETEIKATQDLLDTRWMNPATHTATVRKLRCLNRELGRRFQAWQDAEHLAEQASEIAAENAWLRAAEYDPRMHDPREW
jgi:hypothetical protein